MMVTGYSHSAVHLVKSSLTLLISEVTYYVSSGTLNSTNTVYAMPVSGMHNVLSNDCISLY